MRVVVGLYSPIEHKLNGDCIVYELEPFDPSNYDRKILTSTNNENYNFLVI